MINNDRLAYLTYIRTALAAGVTPLTAAQFLMLTEKDLERHWKRWEQFMLSGDKLALWKENADDREGAWARRSRIHRTDPALMGDVFQSGLFIGELRASGEVCPQEKPETPRWTGELTFRTCRGCGEFLPSFCFAKQLSGRRAKCRWCDNARRRPKS